MHIAVRSSVATGVALVGAGAIALSPVQPIASLSNIHGPTVFSAAGVNLTATFDPVTPWVNIFTEAVDNASAIGADWLADPAPALRQLGTNWFGYANTTATALGGVAQGAYTYFTTTVPEGFTTAFQQLADGDLSGAATTINNTLGSAIFSIGLPLFPVLPIPGQIANNFAAVVNAVTGINTVLPLVVGLLGPLEGSIQAFGDGAQAVLDAVSAGDAVAALNATLGVVPNVLGAIINGYTDTTGSTFPGLLTPEAGGLVYSLAVTLPQAIATALGAPAPPAAASKKAVSAKAASAEASAAVDTDSDAAQSDSAGTTTESDAADASSGASATVKDGNKFEPGETSGSAAGARSAASSKATTSNNGAKKSTAGTSGKGHSARHAGGGES
jgi:hypothetical protein